MFRNREEAGILLGRKLKRYKDSKKALVLAIPRGGAVVGKQIADSLHLPLYLIVVKKLSAPDNPELAIGAITSQGVKVIDENMIARLGIKQEYLDEEIEKKKKEIKERENKLSIVNCFRFSGHRRSGVPSNRREIPQAAGQLSKYKTFILVDDGVATGATTLAAIKYVKKASGIRYQGSGVREEQVLNLLKPETRNLKPEIILAVPVIARDSHEQLKSEVEKIVALEIPDFLGAVGQFYQEFEQVRDEEVINILKLL